MKITTIDAHTAGEPLRIVTSGYPELPGNTMLERRVAARDQFDHLRRLLMLEPRGHADMYGAVLTPPASGDGDVGVLFLHNEGYSTMCGHGIIALVKVGLENDLFAADPGAVRIDTPAGRIVARATMRGDEVTDVAFTNVPSFVVGALTVTVAGLGAVPCTVAYGGAFYAYVDAEPLGLTLAPVHARALIDAGMAIKRAVAAAIELRHPEGRAELNFLYGTIFVAPQTGAHSRNVCIFADGEVDRSPTGTGVSGRAAILHARGELGEAWIAIESILGTRFDVRVAGTTAVGAQPAIVPEVRGRAFVTGRSEYCLDPEDPLGDGFMIR
ncbi:MAG: proline racemase family protein [Planctomycetota bacterium]